MESACRAALEVFDYFTTLSSLMGLKIKPSTSQVALFIIVGEGDNVRKKVWSSEYWVRRADIKAFLARASVCMHVHPWNKDKKHGPKLIDTRGRWKQRGAWKTQTARHRTFLHLRVHVLLKTPIQMKGGAPCLNAGKQTHNENYTLNLPESPVYMCVCKQFDSNYSLPTGITRTFLCLLLYLCIT